MNRRAAAVLCCAVVAALAGCASLPVDGPVQSGAPVAEDVGAVFPVAYGPDLDAAPEDIVNGFLRASAAGLGDGFAVARQYLAEPARSAWKPDAGVVVMQGSVTAEEVATDRVVVSLTPASAVSESGVLTEVMAGTEVDVEFGLVRNADGQWRINSLADGVLLSEPNFSTLYRATLLYFVSPDQTYLVPELRWFPARITPTYAAAALLAGPSEWLRDAVRTAVPDGVGLTLDTVTVTDGVATVDLTTEELSASAEDRALLQAQLDATLTQLPGVRSVSITVGGAPIFAADTPELERDPQPGTTPFMLVDPPEDSPAQAGGEDAAAAGDDATAPAKQAKQADESEQSEPGAGDEVGDQSRDEEVAEPQPGSRLVYWDGSELVPVEGFGTFSGPLIRRPAVSYDGETVVYLDGERGLFLAGEEEVELVSQPGLTPPSMDRHGWVWTSSAEGLLAVLPGGETVTVAADWLADRTVGSLRVSRDGTRIVVISTDANGAVVIEVAGVVRDDVGAPQRLTRPLTVGVPMVQADQAVWVDENTVAVLGRSGTQTASVPYLVTVGGTVRALTGVEDAVRIAAGRSDRSIFLATSAGELYAAEGTGWRLVAEGVQDPTFPG